MTETKPAMDDYLKMQVNQAEEWFIPTKAFDQVTSILDERNYVTIVGLPGQGATTLALMSLSHYEAKGHAVQFIDSLEQFDVMSVTGMKGSITLAFDNFFNSSFQTSEVLDALTEAGSNNADLKVIFTAGAHQLQRAFHENPCYKTTFANVFQDSAVVDLDTQTCLQIDEKKNILYMYLKKTNIQINQNDIDTIVSSETNGIGFPLSCKLFVTINEFQKDPVSFFEKPLKYVFNLFEDMLEGKDAKTAALISMVVMNGHIDSSEVTSKSWTDKRGLNDLFEQMIHGYTKGDIFSGTNVLDGTVFRSSQNRMTFSHPALFDVAASIVTLQLPNFLIQNCSSQFLHDRIKFQSCPKHEKPILFEIYLPESCKDIFVQRLAQEICTGNLKFSVTHHAINTTDVASMLLEEIQEIHDLISVLHSRDSDQGYNFLFWATYAGSPLLCATALELTTYSSSEIMQGVLGCCLNGNQRALITLTNKLDGSDISMVVSKIRGDHIKRPLPRICLENAEISTQDRSVFDTCLHIACITGHIDIATNLVDLGIDVNIGGNYQLTPVMVACLGGNLELLNALVNKGGNIFLYDATGATCLHHACEKGYIDVVDKLLMLGADVNQRDGFGNTPIMFACDSGNTALLSQLIKQGADLTLKDSDGNSPMHHSCCRGHKTIVAMLLDLNVDPNIAGESNSTPLMIASSNNNKDIVNLLLSKGADPKLVSEDGDSCLHYACKFGHADVAAELLQHGLDVSMRGNNGATPIILACVSGNESLVSMLLSAGADVSIPDNDNNTCLHMACHNGRKDVVATLLRVGVDLNSQGNHKATPLIFASMSDDAELVSLLTSSGADVGITDEDGNRVLHVACTYGCKEVVATLLGLGLSVNQRGNHMVTPLMSACQSGNIDLISLLLSKGADVNLKDEAMNTCLHTACDGGQKEAAEKLIALGLDVNSIDINQSTPLLDACRSGNVELVSLLVSSGANVQHCDAFGNSALHIACVEGNKDVVVKLLELGCDVNKRSGKQITPIMAACVSGNMEIVAMLMSAAGLSEHDRDICVRLANTEGHQELANALSRLR